MEDGESTAGEHIYLVQKSSSALEKNWKTAVSY